MMKSITPYNMTTGRDGCKALVTLALLILITLTASGRAAAEDNREAYAVLTTNSDGETKTLTFYYDENKEQNGGMELDETYWKNYRKYITTVVFTPGFKDARPTSCFYWFYECEKLTEIKGIENLNTEMVNDMHSMFFHCESLTSLDLSGFDTKHVRHTASMFDGCTNLITILVGIGWNLEYVSLNASTFMFKDCYKLVGGEGDKCNGTGNKTNAHTGDGGYLCKIEQCQPYAIISEDLETISFGMHSKKLDKNSTNYRHIKLKDASTNESIDEFSNKYKSTITKAVFDNTFTHARPTSCKDWFKGCSNLTEIIGIENLNTEKVDDMSGMFDGCAELKSLDLSGFNTARVENMSGMFKDCKKLESLDLSNFNPTNVKYTPRMFDGCTALKLIDMSRFKISSKDAGTDMMFKDCSSLVTILVGDDWEINAKTSENMFDGCTNLIGGSGTGYDGSHKDAEYAVIDGKDDKSGYLTLNALSFATEHDVTTATIQGDFNNGSGAALMLQKEITVDKVEFFRSFAKGVAATVMFPFSFTSDNSYGTFHTIASVGIKDGVWTAETSNSITDIQANTPYIFNPTVEGGIESMVFNGKITLQPVDKELTNGTDDGWQLHGVYSKKVWKDNSDNEYGFAGEPDNGIQVGEFVLAGAGAWADPMRSYFTYAGTDNPFTIAKAATILPDRIRVVFPQDPDDDNTPATNPDEVITPVSSVTEEAVTKVWAYNRTIFIESPTGSEYTVIDINGRQIKASTTESTHEEVNISKPGVYVVIIGGKSYKVNVN